MTDAPDHPFSPDASLETVRQWVRDHADDGVSCPACTQLAKVYKRKINAGMAKALIIMWRHAQLGWFYLPDITDQWQGRDEAGLRYWDLIVEATEPRPDGGRAGWWRVTERGRDFILGDLRVPKYARVYDGRVLNHKGELVGIRDALASKFSYDDLMEGI